MHVVCVCVFVCVGVCVHARVSECGESVQVVSPVVQTSALFRLTSSVSRLALSTVYCTACGLSSTVYWFHCSCHCTVCRSIKYSEAYCTTCGIVSLYVVYYTVLLVVSIAPSTAFSVYSCLFRQYRLLPPPFFLFCNRERGYLVSCTTECLWIREVRGAALINIHVFGARETVG
jgi:hypothetical protein